jgi:hypothetical protein
MWQVSVFCSGCREEDEIVVDHVDDVEREVCECGHGFVVVTVATFQPVYAEGGQVVELPRRDSAPLAA